MRASDLRLSASTRAFSAIRTASRAAVRTAVAPALLAWNASALWSDLSASGKRFGSIFLGASPERYPNSITRFIQIQRCTVVHDDRF